VHPVRWIHPADLDITRWRVGEHGIPVAAAIVLGDDERDPAGERDRARNHRRGPTRVNTPGPVSVMATVRFVVTR
jgi:hypothetical protein